MPNLRQSVVSLPDSAPLGQPSVPIVGLQEITAAEVREKGKGLAITYGLHLTPWGPLFLALTPRGVARAVFLDGASGAETAPALEAQLEKVQELWPLAHYRRNDERTEAVAKQMLAPVPPTEALTLHIRGTAFQLSVWRALLDIPRGSTRTYADIAARLGCPKAARAVGNAIGANPVALLIPCHRVVQRSGALGGYRWGPARKQRILAWEQANGFATGGPGQQMAIEPRPV